jgi:transcriptional regulator with XRE-family HTH domain
MVASPKKKKKDTEETSTVRQTFASRLVLVRQTRGMSQPELGKLIFGKTTMSNTNQVGEWERGMRLPGAARLANISRACEVSVDWLLGLVD